MSKSKCPTSDHALLLMLQGSEEQCHHAIECIYGPLGWAGKAMGLFLKMGAQGYDAEDALMDTYEIFVRQIRNNEFQGNSHLESYFISVAKNTWLNRNRKINRIDLKPDMWHEFAPLDFEDDEGRLIKEECRQIVKALCEQIAEPCRSMIYDAASGFTTSELVIMYDTGTVDNLKKRKFRCMEKLREKIHSSNYTDHLMECLNILART
jgi:DNA-directed RNA polymerase specialized sigma24 family protein